MKKDKNKDNTIEKDLLIKKLNIVLEENISLKKNIKQKNNILYNIEQGLLLFDKSLIVKDEISMKAIELFQMDIRESYFPDILYPLDEEKNKFLAKILPKILSEKNKSKREIYLSLLTRKMTLNGISIEIIYKIITNSLNELEMIVIITDLSELEHVEEEKKLEIEKLNRIITISNGYNDFMIIYNEYIQFFVRDIFLIIDDKEVSNIQKVLEIFRKVHTFKGNFSQFNLTTLANNLHKFETEIEKNKESLSNQNSAELLKFISRKNFIGWLDREMKDVKLVLGHDYFKSASKITIGRDKVYEIHDLIKERVSKHKANEILPFLLDILKIPLSSMFQYFQDYLVSLASSQNKRINLPKIIGGDFLIDTKRFNPFVKSLVHIFRNCISHGIETPEERVLNDKKEFGNIDIYLGKNSDNLYIMINDDGRGIDEKAIKNKLLEKKLFTEKQLRKMSDSKILEQIFNEGFSTQEKTTELSGRGMGLSAVKTEVDKLNGTIDIESNVNTGTSFIFNFPYIDLSKKKHKTSIFDIMESTVDTLHDLIVKEINIKIIENENNFIISKTPKLELNNITAILNTVGVLKGAFVLSVTKELAKKMAEVFIGSDYSESLTNSSKESIIETYESATAEYSNIIIGNSIKKFKNIENLMDISSPYTIISEQTTIKYLNSKVYYSDIHTDFGIVKLYFISDSDIEDLII